MRGADVRDSFIAYFAAREHRVVRSSPLVPVGDPTLLFTNAGMNQFKDLFTGRETRDYRRAVSAQKCLRVSGKHNDLEQVGRTPRHHTFFEMLGNFSFGDYFKEEAVRLAWDLMTRAWGIPPERLTATVFGGEADLPPDTEAEDLWRRVAGLPEARIRRFGARDNFWRMGDTGPCGPCSELHYDQGPERGCGRADCAGPACECDRFLEIWNLVFMQFDQQAGGRLPLPKPSIDTGMGLERIAAVLQGRTSNYETDLFAPLLDAIAAVVRQEPDTSGPARVSLQVIADHLRAISFLIADGVVPGNEGRGYVLRRVLRRAFRHGRLLGQDGPFLHRLTGVVVDTMGSAYPELETSRAALAEVCLAEEERFEDTLAESLRRLEECFDRHARSRRLPGEELFRLYDTFGMPLDFAEELARDKGFELDMEGYAAALEAQRTRARESWKGGGGGPATAAFDTLRARGVQTRFLGYETDAAAARVVGLVRGEAEVEALPAGGGDLEEAFHVVLDQTPLYAEAGGQVGEHGRIEWEGGRAEVLDSSSPAAGLIAHRIRLLDGRLAVGDAVRVRSEPEERRATRRNHTATHLLHAALKAILGPHVKQAGSLVAPDRLRFDFTHWRPLSPGRLREIEDLVNAKILENQRTETRLLPLDEALATGAVALFGEKYAAHVRVVSVPGFSSELCGGLHCGATGDIGLFKIIGERGIAAGVRRLEAVTGRVALSRFQADEDRLAAAAAGLGVPREELVAGAERIQRRLREQQQEIERLRMKLAGGGASGAAAGEVRQVDGLSVLTRRVEDLDRTQMRQLADTLKGRADVVVLGMAAGDRVSLLVAVRDGAAGRVPARALADRLARLVDGRGGGKDTLAEAGGRDPARLDEALRQGSGVVRQILGLPEGDGA